MSQPDNLLKPSDGVLPVLAHDDDPRETSEWLQSLDYVCQAEGAGGRSSSWSGSRSEPFNVASPSSPAPRRLTSTRFRSTSSRSIPATVKSKRRIKSILRWNAMAMVVRANKESPGIGGHISTYASAATLYEVAFNHFFHGKQGNDPPDQVFFQGHAAPGIYARAFLTGRIDEAQLKNFRRESASGGGLSSYPHPWLMPNFWEFPTVSMGLGPIMAIYQARFNYYLVDRGIKPDARASRVWAFLGDGETDEPEALGAITLAGREKLDNLIFVVNCNLQRLDGPVRGNGKIVQELEGAFRGAGWNVIKVLWGDDWDPLLAQDHDGLLVRRMGEVVDGEYQKYTVASGAYIREHFFGADPRLRPWSRTSATTSSANCAAAATIRPRSMPPIKRRSPIKARRRSFSPRPSRATDWARPAKAAISPIRRRSSTKKSWCGFAAASRFRFPMKRPRTPFFIALRRTVRR